MAKISVHDVGSIGIIKDVPDHLLPPGAWSDGANVRFQDGKVIKFTGDRDIFDPPTVAPIWALFCPTATSGLWLYTSLTKAYAVENSVHTEITNVLADYTANITDGWNGGLLGGIPVITNGVDDPQAWSPIASGTPLVDLVNWPASTQCKVIRPFLNFLVALHITKSGTISPHMVKWSHSADPGTLPTSWDEADATKDTGETELTDVEAGLIRDGMALGNRFFIYKDSATHSMQHIGGQFIFRFEPFLLASGILSTDCVTMTPNGLGHFVATGDDIIIHDGTKSQSILDKKWRKFLANDIDSTNFRRSFTVSNRKEQECWFCYPEPNESLPTKALVWNALDNTIGIRDLADLAYIAPGIIDDSLFGLDVSWDGDADTWDGDTTIWDDLPFNPQSPGLLGCDNVNTKLRQMDKLNQFRGASFNSFVERRGLALLGKRDGITGAKVADFENRKLITRVWLKMTGGPVQVSVGSQEILGGTVTYETAQTFTPGTDNYLDTCSNGRLMAIKIESTADVSWELHGYDVEVQVLGAL